MSLFKAVLIYRIFGNDVTWLVNRTLWLYYILFIAVQY